MRIAHVSQPTDGGCAVVVRDLTRAGIAAGDDVTVVSPVAGPLRDWTLAAGARHVPLELRRSPRPWRDARLAMALRRLVGGHDVVHLHSSMAGAVGRAAFALGSRPRLVFTPHGWSWLVGGRAAVAYRTVERVLARRADAVVAVSAGELADGRRVLGPRAPLVVVENGVDLDAFADPAVVPAPLAGRPVVQVGRLSRQKGQDLTLRALARLRTPDVRVTFVGDGEARAELVELAARLGLADRVDLAGVTDPRPYLRAAEVVAMPSRWEGMSLAMLEAMAAGAPIVTTACAGTDALGDAGLVLPAGQTEEDVVRSLADAIDRLFEDDELRRTLGGRARARSRDYSLERMSQSYRELYRGE